MSKLHTVEDVVSMFEGPRNVAAWAGISENGVNLWRARNRIPPSAHLRLIIEARNRGFEVTNNLLGLPDDEFQELQSMFLPAGPCGSAVAAE